MSKRVEHVLSFQQIDCEISLLINYTDEYKLEKRIRKLRQETYISEEQQNELVIIAAKRCKSSINSKLLTNLHLHKKGLTENQTNILIQAIDGWDCEDIIGSIKQSRSDSDSRHGPIIGKLLQKICDTKDSDRQYNEFLQHTLHLYGHYILNNINEAINTITINVLKKYILKNYEDLKLVYEEWQHVFSPLVQQELSQKMVDFGLKTPSESKELLLTCELKGIELGETSIASLFNKAIEVKPNADYLLFYASSMLSCEQIGRLKKLQQENTKIATQEAQTSTIRLREWSNSWYNLPDSHIEQLLKVAITNGIALKELFTHGTMKKFSLEQQKIIKATISIALLAENIIDINNWPLAVILIQTIIREQQNINAEQLAKLLSIVLPFLDKSVLSWLQSNLFTQEQKDEIQIFIASKNPQDSRIYLQRCIKDEKYISLSHFNMFIYSILESEHQSLILQSTSGIDKRLEKYGANQDILWSGVNHINA